MLGKCFQHVIEETDAGFDVRLSRPIQIDGNRNVGFLGGSGNCSSAVRSHAGPYSALEALQLARFVH